MSRSKCQMPIVMPIAKPITPNSTNVPNCRSTQRPKRPGTSISRQTVNIREAQWYAFAIGERSSDWGSRMDAIQSGNKPLCCKDLQTTLKADIEHGPLKEVNLSQAPISVNKRNPEFDLFLLTSFTAQVVIRQRIRCDNLPHVSSRRRAPPRPRLRAPNKPLPAETTATNHPFGWLNVAIIHRYA